MALVTFATIFPPFIRTADDSINEKTDAFFRQKCFAGLDRQRETEAAVTMLRPHRLHQMHELPSFKTSYFIFFFKETADFVNAT
jgi:hypothetical protein